MILIQRLQQISAFSLGRIGKHEYLTGGKEIFSSDRSRTIEQANFTYSSFGKAF